MSFFKYSQDDVLALRDAAAPEWFEVPSSISLEPRVARSWMHGPRFLTLGQLSSA
jgi:hypothetical protein